MYVRPSASTTFDPHAREMNKGFPPTDLNARTGEFTPPGMILTARRKSLRETGPAEFIPCLLVPIAESTTAFSPPL